MSLSKKRLISAILFLSLLSVCFWSGWETLNVAAAKRSEKAAAAFCSTIRSEQGADELLARVKQSAAAARVDQSGESMRISFGEHCQCEVTLTEGKVSDKTASCGRKAA